MVCGAHPTAACANKLHTLQFVVCMERAVLLGTDSLGAS